MTERKYNEPSSVLETILETVKSIDGKVDEILERLDEAHYRRAWNGGYEHNGEEQC